MRPCRGAATSISDRRCGVASADPLDCAQAGKVCKPRPATPRSKSWRLSCNRYVTWSSIGDIPFGSLLAHNQMERMLTLATRRLAQCAVHCCHLYEATSGLTFLPGSSSGGREAREPQNSVSPRRIVPGATILLQIRVMGSHFEERCMPRTPQCAVQRSSEQPSRFLPCLLLTLVGLDS